MSIKNTFYLEFEVCCGQCGEKLEVSETNLNISVEPCQECIEKAIGEAKREL